MPSFAVLLAWCLSHKIAIAETLAVAQVPALALELLLLSRVAPWLRSHAPRMFAALHALYALSPQLIRCARMLLAIWRPSYLVELDALAAAIKRAKSMPPPAAVGALMCLALAGCGPMQRAGECQAAPGVETALDTVVNVVVQDVASGTLPAPLVPLVADAVTALEGWINGHINHALCATPAPSSPSARLRQAILAHPVPAVAP